MEIGAARAEVEKLLGPPVAEDHEGPYVVDASTAWYLTISVPPIMSPYGPGAICVDYRQGFVVAKKLDPNVGSR